MLRSNEQTQVKIPKVYGFLIMCYALLIIPQSFAVDTPALEVTPVRIELSGDPGTTITGMISLNNYTPNTIPLTVEAQNCTVANNIGTPHCLPVSQTITTEKFAEWVSTDITQFSISSMGKQTITYSISIPTDAVPGGHYGAILFNYSTPGNGGTTLSTIKSLGPIFLLNVNGNVIVDGEVTEITTGGGGWGNGESDNTKGLTFFTSIFKNILGSGPRSLSDIVRGDTDDTSSGASDEPVNTPPEKEKEEDITFTITFNNDGNTHIKPEGKVVITDEDGNVLKGIGKKVVFNELGAVIGDKIVDFLPINDQGGNVLPGSERTFDITWEGFPYAAIDETGKQIVKYKPLGEYYTEQNLKGKTALDINFWEKIKSRISKKKLTANISVVHKDKDGKDVEFNSAKDIYVEYEEQYIGINETVLGIIGGLGIIILLTWLKIGALKSSAIVASKVSASGLSSAKKLVVAKTPETYYDILNVGKKATKKEIIDAYKKLIKEKKGNKKVEKAYSTLSEKKTRDEYDKSLAK